MHRGKVDPGVSELPRGNELSRDHVNRPLVGPGITASLILKSVFKTYKRPMVWSNIITHVHDDYFFALLLFCGKSCISFCLDVLKQILFGISFVSICLKTELR